MALENGIEHLETWESGCIQRKAGMCIIAFLDVDWDALLQRCEALCASQTNLSQNLAEFYAEIKKELSQQHPLLEVFACNQLIGDMKAISLDHFSADTTLPEWRYVMALAHGSEFVVVSDELPRLILRQLSTRFQAFAQMKESLLRIMDDIFCQPETKNPLSVLQAYYLMRESSHDYMVLSKRLYPSMKTEFRLAIDGQLRGISLPRAPTHADRAYIEKKSVSAHTYHTTDHLEALLLWELDYMVASSIAMRRCGYCGRYFVPYSVVNCYCDRLVVDGKTCKEVGAATKHQQEVSSNAAKALYKKVNNRTQQAAKRLEPQYSNIWKVNYKRWQFEAKRMLEQVENGEMEYQDFAEKMKPSSRELLGL